MNKKGKKVKNPSRWSPLLTERHKPSRGAKLKETGRRIRYLYKYEKNPDPKGYSELGISNKHSTRADVKSPQLRIGNLQGSAGRGLIKSGIVLENTAPYADAVQLRYYVLKHSLARKVFGKYGGKGATLMRVMTKRVLKKAGFNVK